MANLKPYSSGLAQAVEELPQAVLIVDPKLVIQYANPHAGAYFGYAEKDLLGAKLTKLIASKHRREIQHAVAISLKKTTAPDRRTLFTTIQLSDRSVQFAHVTLAPLQMNNGETHLYVRFNRALLEAQLPTVASEQITMALLSTNAIKALDMIEDAVVIYDNEWRYQFLNEAAWKVVKRDKSEILGKIVWEVYPQIINSDFYFAALRSMKQQTQIVIEEYYSFAHCWYQTKFYPSPSSLVTQIQDITEMVEARNINQQLTGSLEQAMEVYWSDANRTRRESKQHKSH